MQYGGLYFHFRRTVHTGCLFERNRGNRTCQTCQFITYLINLFNVLLHGVGRVCCQKCRWLLLFRLYLRQIKIVHHFEVVWLRLLFIVCVKTGMKMARLCEWTCAFLFTSTFLQGFVGVEHSRGGNFHSQFRFRLLIIHQFTAANPIALLLWSYIFWNYWSKR